MTQANKKNKYIIIIMLLLVYNLIGFIVTFGRDTLVIETNSYTDMGKGKTVEVSFDRLIKFETIIDDNFGKVTVCNITPTHLTLINTGVYEEDNSKIVIIFRGQTKDIGVGTYDYSKTLSITYK